MNWLRATPSVSETRRASSSIDACRRKATLLLLIPSDLPPRIAWPQHSNPKPASRIAKVTHIEGDRRSASPLTAVSNTISSAGSFSRGRHRNQKWNRDRYLHQSIENLIHLPRRKATGLQVFRSRQNRLVFEHQWDRSKHLKYAIQSTDQQLSGRSAVASEAATKSGIKNQPQERPPDDNITCNSTCIEAAFDAHRSVALRADFLPCTDEDSSPR